MNGGSGLPEPFHDADGFPLPLAHLRAEVRARGGDIVGAGLEWRITHPDPALPDIRIVCYARGNVVIDIGGGRGMDVFEEEAWRLRTAPAGWTHLEVDLLAFLDGGFSQEEWFNDRGELMAWGIVLVGKHVNEAGGRLPPIDPAWTKEESSYPAWPPRT